MKKITFSTLISLFLIFTPLIKTSAAGPYNGQNSRPSQPITIAKTVSTIAQATNAHEPNTYPPHEALPADIMEILENFKNLSNEEFLEENLSTLENLAKSKTESLIAKIQEIEGSINNNLLVISFMESIKDLDETIQNTINKLFIDAIQNTESQAVAGSQYNSPKAAGASSSNTDTDKLQITLLELIEEKSEQIQKQPDEKENIIKNINNMVKNAMPNIDSANFILSLTESQKIGKELKNEIINFIYSDNASTIKKNEDSLNTPSTSANPTTSSFSQDTSTPEDHKNITVCGFANLAFEDENNSTFNSENDSPTDNQTSQIVIEIVDTLNKLKLKNPDNKLSKTSVKKEKERKKNLNELERIKKSFQTQYPNSLDKALQFNNDDLKEKHSITEPMLQIIRQWLSSNDKVENFVKKLSTLITEKNPQPI